MNTIRNPKHEKTAKNFKIIGFILLTISLIIFITGVILFISSFGNFSSGVGPMILITLGGFGLVISSGLLRAGYKKKVLEYNASQSMPVVADSLNYVVEETSETIKNNLTNTVNKETIIKVRCKNCKALNDEHAKYCNNCGKPLI